MGKIIKFKPKRKRKVKLPGAWQPFIQKRKQPRLWQGAVAAALIGTLIGLKSLNLGGVQLPFISSEAMSKSSAQTAQHIGICEGEGTTTCVVDGDTLHIAGERIRLLGIDAPELPGHCAIGRVCAPGDPFAATTNLARVLGSGPLYVERIGVDRYGRTLALVKAGDVDVSCAQLKDGFALYKSEWDNGGRLAARCPAIPAN